MLFFIFFLNRYLIHGAIWSTSGISMIVSFEIDRIHLSARIRTFFFSFFSLSVFFSFLFFFLSFSLFPLFFFLHINFLYSQYLVLSECLFLFDFNYSYLYLLLLQHIFCRNAIDISISFALSLLPFSLSLYWSFSVFSISVFLSVLQANPDIRDPG